MTEPVRPWSRWGQKLYVRIWLAVVLAVAALTLLVAWAWRQTAEPPLRTLLVRNDLGEVIGSAHRALGNHGVVSHGGPEFLVTLNDGRELHIHLPRPPGRSPFGTQPYGFIGLLVLVGCAVALATYPITRHLTRRLETLQHGVERWGSGDLSTRLMLAGDDEVGQLASRFNDAAERIENLLAAHKSLLANASHELRSPLARIRMGLDLPPTPALQTEIARSVEELNQLIDEILLASRLEASQADLGTLIQVDLTGLVAEECAHTGAVFEPLSIDPVMVPGVLKLVRRVVRNVLENARRYSDGEVNVTLAQSDGFAVLCVADAGPGVPEGLRTRIFEPFYRLPGASEQSGGVGLGLSLVKSITERMAGTVHCESPAKGVGAVFVVRLPTV